MTTTNLINVIGWIFLILSWVIPYVMKRMDKDSVDKYFVGAVLAAVSVGFFASSLIVMLMK